jgi:hypothetical protein
MRPKVDLGKLYNAIEDAISAFPEDTTQMSRQDIALLLRLNRLRLAILKRLGRMKP